MAPVIMNYFDQITPAWNGQYHNTLILAALDANSVVFNNMTYSCDWNYSIDGDGQWRQITIFLPQTTRSMARRDVCKGGARHLYVAIQVPVHLMRPSFRRWYVLRCTIEDLASTFVVEIRIVSAYPARFAKLFASWAWCNLRGALLASRVPGFTYRNRRALY